MAMAEVVVGALAGTFGGAAAGWSTAYFTFRMSLRHLALTSTTQRDHAEWEIQRSATFEAASTVWDEAHRVAALVTALRETGASDLDPGCRHALMQLTFVIQQRGMVMGDHLQAVFRCNFALKKLMRYHGSENGPALAETVLHHLQWVAVSCMRGTPVPTPPPEFEQARRTLQAR
ncbi:hypothetical protein [Streptodolium elevatio]|uniref:Uncharacterized protein n=1 Tax=Streptodolium elevatio TaxID=3157996 RepID=A0ABV3DVQ7_9ACTN